MNHWLYSLSLGERLIKLISLRQPYYQRRETKRISRRSRLLLLLAFAVAGFTMPASPIWGQQVAAILSPDTSNTDVLRAVCFDQVGRIIPNCNVTVSSGVVLNTNGHFHDDPSRPISSVSPTSGNTGANGLPLTIRTTIIGQAEFIEVCSNFCTVTLIGVGFTGLMTTPADNNYELIGGNTNNHGDNTFNHWGTPTMISGIRSTVSQYLAKHPEQGKLALNDMALPNGGKFDIDQNWMGRHERHHRGTAVDVRGNSLQFALPGQFQNEFINLCQMNGATFTRQEDVGTG
ncbi:MAG: hypothetical protein ACRD4L_03430, partial [Pyrinomonadaceae bacterium]